MPDGVVENTVEVDLIFLHNCSFKPTDPESDKWSFRGFYSFIIFRWNMQKQQGVRFKLKSLNQN